MITKNLSPSAVCHPYIADGAMPAKATQTLRVVSINVNGLRAACKKGFLDWLISSDIDVVCLQETRLSLTQWHDSLKPKDWFCYLFAAQRPGYAGTAIYSRLPACHVQEGLGFDVADQQGRFISIDIDVGLAQLLTIGSLYLPSGSSGEEAQARKDKFLLDYQHHLAQWRIAQRSLIIGGDYNMIHQRQDIKHWSSNQKASGCLPHERAWLDYVYHELGYIDSFRTVCQAVDAYSWWSNRGQARANNAGWRIDYHMCSPDWLPRVRHAYIYTAQWFSDHAPVIIDYDITP